MLMVRIVYEEHCHFKYDYGKQMIMDLYRYLFTNFFISMQEKTQSNNLHKKDLFN